MMNYRNKAYKLKQQDVTASKEIKIKHGRLPFDSPKIKMASEPWMLPVEKIPAAGGVWAWPYFMQRQVRRVGKRLRWSVPGRWSSVEFCDFLNALRQNRPDIIFALDMIESNAGEWSELSGAWMPPPGLSLIYRQKIATALSCLRLCIINIDIYADLRLIVKFQTLLADRESVTGGVAARNAAFDKACDDVSEF